ncbi:MAG: hypothetical protein O4861_16340 [Trichodesmium sp. St16_bin4-tuft]|nr:hypothetical protein [Trichodesmium sp. St4_bin8_1]MDE5073707.1 hypothetical protein [Trichodesmium sp. St5_bin8]MDE5077163.1 hypothetical protein [Trichodesmium sp. St2_bin6]MDE5090729.1 hypothetical protein [Trichodesmium sp. St18_bin3_1_1]MDE5099815.1 hypothetical protein [Trichodesmium sp. St16_bin4-tuft]MDE5102793.1 hypothetical protein [Trichodesmium sp. St19_bin2]
MSISKLVHRFGVSQNFLQTLTKKYQETGDMKPLPQGGSLPSQLNSEELVILVEIMEKNNDATHEKLFVPSKFLLLMEFFLGFTKKNYITCFTWFSSFDIKNIFT